MAVSVAGLPQPRRSAEATSPAFGEQVNARKQRGGNAAPTLTDQMSLSVLHVLLQDLGTPTQIWSSLGVWRMGLSRCSDHSRGFDFMDDRAGWLLGVQ